MSDEKTDYKSKHGKIPPEHFDNDLPFEADVDKAKGSLYDKVKGKIKSPPSSADKK